jgi:hypothetical protein
LGHGRGRVSVIRLKRVLFSLNCLSCVLMYRFGAVLNAINKNSKTRRFLTVAAVLFFFCFCFFFRFLFFCFFFFF